MPKRARGRPRAFDEDAALDAAMVTFWARGFSATSLDDLGRAMEMNRPSIANAFGDKEALYRRTLHRFVGTLKQEVGRLLAEQATLRGALLGFYDAALAVYFGSTPAPGCFVMCTAPVEAVEHPEVRADLRRLIADLDGLLESRFVRAKAEGELSSRIDPKAAARLTQAVLHSLAIRARAGAGRASLTAMARQAVDMLEARP